jgi:hypothetical protein
MNYSCCICGYSSDVKNSLKLHLNRKKFCGTDTNADKKFFSSKTGTYFNSNGDVIDDLKSGASANDISDSESHISENSHDSSNNIKPLVPNHPDSDEDDVSDSETESVINASCEFDKKLSRDAMFSKYKSLRFLLQDYKRQIRKLQHDNKFLKENQNITNNIVTNTYNLVVVEDCTGIEEAKKKYFIDDNIYKILAYEDLLNPTKPITHTSL